MLPIKPIPDFKKYGLKIAEEVATVPSDSGTRTSNEQSIAESAATTN